MNPDPNPDYDATDEIGSTSSAGSPGLARHGLDWHPAYPPVCHPRRTTRRPRRSAAALLLPVFPAVLSGSLSVAIISGRSSAVPM